MKAVLAALYSVVLAIVASPAFAQTPDIRVFVQTVHVEGVPYEQAIRFDADADTTTLLQMLADPNEEPYWHNIVITLGMLGNERAVEPLIRFLEQGAGGRLSRRHHAAKNVVPLALGYLVNRSQNQAALAYLQAGVKPEGWLARNLKWVSPVHETNDGRNQQLSKMAILGLALSAHPAAGQTLLTLQGPATSEAERAFRARVRGLIANAVDAHQKIERQGLVTYDSSRRNR